MNIKKNLFAFTALLFCFWAATPVLAGEIHTAKVLMAQHAGKYTFMLVNQDDEQKWLASNFLDIAPGDTVEYSGGLMMREFYSPAMNHTFAELLMVTNIRIAEAVELPGDDTKAARPDEPQAPKEMRSPVVMPAPPLAREAGQISIADLYANSEDLAGKSVSLRAVVMGVSSNIQGKNWVTLADGTGTAPDNILLAVTADTASLGETVSVQGTVQIDVSLGGMHTYKVLLGNARFSR